MNEEQREALLDALLLCYEEIREEREEDWTRYDEDEWAIGWDEFWD